MENYVSWCFIFYSLIKVSEFRPDSLAFAFAWLPSFFPHMKMNFFMFQKEDNFLDLCLLLTHVAPFSL